MAKSNSELDNIAEPRLAPYGDGAIYLEYETLAYDASVNKAVLNLAARLRESGNWVDVVSGYNSLIAVFNPHKMTLDTAAGALEEELARVKKIAARKPKTIDVPVYYGGEFGPDMETLIKSSGLSEDEIVKSHSEENYHVCIMGFVPGFTFLSEAPKALHHPRLEKPRLSVPSGSIGIAGWQTGIYGLSSPGGWQIIGRTPLKIFDAKREPAFLWEAGDQLRFIPQAGPFPNEVEIQTPFPKGGQL